MTTCPFSYAASWFRCAFPAYQAKKEAEDEVIRLERIAEDVRLGQEKANAIQAEAEVRVLRLVRLWAYSSN